MHIQPEYIIALVAGLAYAITEALDYVKNNKEEDENTKESE